MNDFFEYTSALQIRLKAAQNELDSFKSGKKYIQMREHYSRDVRALEREIRDLKLALSKARSTIITMRNDWFEIYEDISKEHEKEVRKLKSELKKMERRALKAEHALDQAQDTITQQRHDYYSISIELMEEKEKNLNLHAQINRNYENSSTPSSLSKNRKKITNNREKTERKPGGQPGHKHHGRKRQTPTHPAVYLQAPAEILDDPDFKPTGRYICKQKVGIKILLDVQDYYAQIYRNSKTGETAHAVFPKGVTDDVNYDASIRAFLFLLNNECCISIDKSRQFLSDLTGGQLNISKGMVNNLCKVFSQKTEADRKKLFADLMLSPVMHVDCTNANVNGEKHYVFLCGDPNGNVLYQARKKKGHEGVKGTPAEEYQGILVHDHETTFYSYGSNHQECLAHILRYLKDSIQNEPERKWNAKMRCLLQEMIHYRNGILPNEKTDSAKVAEFEGNYHNILQMAYNEYADTPPSDYYREGYNLYKRMMKYADNHLLSLYDVKVPATNNKAERCLRIYKRKQVQAMSFRSAESIGYLNTSLPVNQCHLVSD